MSEIFVSHSSLDAEPVRVIAEWLDAHGFKGRYFLDTRADANGIQASERWRDELRRAKRRCRIAIFLVSPNWLSSAWCAAEFEAAGLLGKRRLPILIEGLARDGRNREAADRLAGILAEEQAIDWTAQKDWADRLTQALSLSGLLPNTFRLDSSIVTEPYPGLSSFGDSDSDAALFFGRDAEIAELLDRLRIWRRGIALQSGTQPRRPFMVIGASGSGKSSFLRAGILPRLRREGPAWIVLRPVRPGRDPLQALAESLAGEMAAYQVPKTAGELLAGLRGSPEESLGLLVSSGEQLREASGRSGSTIVLPIDQGEELFGESPDHAKLCELLRGLADTATNWLTILSIRSDALSAIQSHPTLKDLPAEEAFDLRPLPRSRLSDVIEKPAAAFGATVDPRLTEALISQTPSADALPLLAFALQNLWRARKRQHALDLEDLPDGGIESIVADAAERTLFGLSPNDASPLPNRPPPSRKVYLARSVFVPRLVSVNQLNVAARRVAYLHDFVLPEEREYIEQCAVWRLLTLRQNAGATEVEVTHEAIFRTWPRFRDEWLVVERSNLALADEITTAASDWVESGRQSRRLLHRGRKLGAAKRLRKRFDYRTLLDRTLAENKSTNRGRENARYSSTSYLQACSRTQARNRVSAAFVLTGLALGAIWIPLQNSASQQQLRLIQEASSMGQSREAAVVAALAVEPPDRYFVGDGAAAEQLLQQSGYDRELLESEACALVSEPRTQVCPEALSRFFSEGQGFGYDCSPLLPAITTVRDCYPLVEWRAGDMEYALADANRNELWLFERQAGQTAALWHDSYINILSWPEEVASRPSNWDALATEPLQVSACPGDDRFLWLAAEALFVFDLKKRAIAVRKYHHYEADDYSTPVKCLSPGVWLLAQPRTKSIVILTLENNVLRDEEISDARLLGVDLIYSHATKRGFFIGDEHTYPFLWNGDEIEILEAANVNLPRGLTFSEDGEHIAGIYGDRIALYEGNGAALARFRFVPWTAEPTLNIARLADRNFVFSARRDGLSGVYETTRAPIASGVLWTRLCGASDKSPVRLDEIEDRVRNVAPMYLDRLRQKCIRGES